MNAIKYGLAAILSVVLTTMVFAGSGARKSEVNPAHLLGTWWVKHDLGSMDGYQMESDGRLVLVNHYSWFGARWSLSGDTLTWVMYEEGQEPEVARYIVTELTEKGLKLDPITENAGTKLISLRKHAGTKAPDSWTGRWSGVNGSFLDIVPQSSGFRIVIVQGGKLNEYRGSADADRIKFARHGVEETIRMPRGDEKGLKWMEGKPQRLIIRENEGYYRD